nr:MAG TPA: hypothetical protein [Caudoviricetes sp.]
MYTIYIASHQGCFYYVQNVMTKKHRNSSRTKNGG